MTKLSYTSRLIELAASGKHYDVKVDPVSLQRLIVWVDAMCPYNGDEEVRADADPSSRASTGWRSARGSRPPHGSSGQARWTEDGGARRENGISGDSGR